MNQNPIIKALRESLEKERDVLSDSIGTGYTKLVGSYGSVEKNLDFNAARWGAEQGHEAATARLLGLLEKAVEMAEFYADEGSWNWTDYNRTIIKGVDGDLREYEDKSENHFVGGKKAREFLTTLADASSELNKEIE